MALEENSIKILQALNAKTERKGDLAEILWELNIGFIQADLKDYAEYFKQTGYARTALSKDGCQLTMTLKGVDFIDSVSNLEQNSPQINVRSQKSPASDEKSEIKKLITQGNLATTLQRLSEGTDNNGQKDLHKKLLFLSSRFQLNEKKNRNGTISSADYSLEWNKVSSALIDFLEEYKPSIKKDEKPSPDKPGRFKKSTQILTAIFFFVIVYVFFVQFFRADNTYNYENEITKFEKNLLGYDWENTAFGNKTVWKFDKNNRLIKNKTDSCKYFLTYEDDTLRLAINDDNMMIYNLRFLNTYSFQLDPPKGVIFVKNEKSF